MRRDFKKRIVSLVLCVSIIATFFAQSSPVFAVGEDPVSDAPVKNSASNTGKQAIFDWSLNFMLVDDPTREDIADIYWDTDTEQPHTDGEYYWYFYDEKFDENGNPTGEPCIGANGLVMQIADYYYDGDNGWHWYKVTGDHLPDPLVEKPWVLYCTDMDIEEGFDPYLCIYEKDEVIRFVYSENDSHYNYFVVAGPSALRDAEIKITARDSDYAVSDLAYVELTYGTTFSKAFDITITKSDEEAWTPSDGIISIRYEATQLGSDTYTEFVPCGAGFVYVDGQMYSAAATDRWYEISDVVYTNSGLSTLVFEHMLSDFEWIGLPGYFANATIRMYSNTFETNECISADLPERVNVVYAFTYQDVPYFWLEHEDFIGSPYFIVKASDVILERTLTDYSNKVTVTGDIPVNVYLQIDGISNDKLNAVSNGLIDKSGFSEILSISGKNITLLDGNSGNPWRPDADRPVTVTISDVWAVGGKTLPVADVYHILDDAAAVEKARAGGYLLTCTDPAVLALYPQEAALLDGSAVPYVRMLGIDGGAAVNEDGSVTFETDSFSDYFIVLGFTDGLSLSNNGNDTYYVEPGTTLTFNRSATWTPQGTVPTGITASGSSVTIGSGVAVPSEVTYQATWSSWFTSGSATVTIKVATVNQIIAGALNDEKYPIILSVIQGVSTIPSEPGRTSGSYYQINDSYNADQSYPPKYMFASTANGIIDPGISDFLTKAIDSSNTIGFADATGVTMLRYLTGIDWDKVLDRAVSERWEAIDGTTVTSANKNQYKIIPYVVKLMDGANSSGKGWHIDCAIVKKDNVTLSYDVNLDNYQVSGTLKLPNTASGVPDPTFNTSVGNITHGSTNLKVGSTIRATYNGEQMTLTFMGCNTSPDGKGTMYAPGAAIDISEDTVLYAIWEGELVPGELHIYKTVTTEDGTTEPNNATYQFNVQFGTAGTYSYTVYNADGSTASSGSFNTQGTVVLANGQYAVFVGIPANTTYTVTEKAGSYTTTSEGGSGVVRSGGRAVARFVNHYAYIEPEVTITFIAKDGGSVTISSETVKVNTGNAQGSTANPGNGYQFVGWFRDAACTQPVDPSWITSGNHLVPQKEDGAYREATYYAKFESAVTSLTISKTGYANIDENQTFLFQVTGENVNLTVTVHGNGSTTINGLKVGGQYTVTELTDWSWRYEFSGWAFASNDAADANGNTNNASVTLGTGGNVLTFTNIRDENKWLDGDSWLDNLFKVLKGN